MNRLFISGFILSAALLIPGCGPQEKKEEPRGLSNELPYLAYTDLQTGAPASTRDLPGNSILILFNCDCDHCQREASEISSKEGFFKNHQIYFIASDSVHQIKSFSKRFGLEGKKNIHLGHAEYMDIFMNFGAIPTPAIYIYSKEKKLVKSFMGETPVQELIKYL
jgi:thiol-disulfide isomerase/thioredoxin